MPKRKPLEDRTHLSARMDDQIRAMLKEIWEIRPLIKDNDIQTVKEALDAYLKVLKSSPSPVMPTAIATPQLEPESGGDAETNWQDEDP